MVSGILAEQPSRPFSDGDTGQSLRRSLVLFHVSAVFGFGRLSRGPLEPLQEMLLRIAAVYQFDVPFDGKGEDPVALRRLLKERLISVVGGTGEYRMQHSSDARFLVESEAATRRKSPEEVTVKCLQYYLERGAASYYQLLVALRRTGETLSACLAAPLKTDELVATAARGELGEIADRKSVV